MTFEITYSIVVLLMPSVLVASSIWLQRIYEKIKKN